MRLLRVETPLGLFSVLWAVGAALHDLEDSPLDGLPLYPFAVLLLLNPERIWAIGTFALVHAFLLFLKLPAAANHSVLSLLVDLGLLIGCVHALRGGPAASQGRRLLGGAARPGPGHRRRRLLLRGLPQAQQLVFRSRGELRRHPAGQAVSHARPA